MKTIQIFNATGIFGAALWVLGPIVLGVGYMMSLGQAPYEQGALTGSVLIMAFGGLLSSISVPMMLIGREYHRQ